MQQAVQLAANFKRLVLQKEMEPFAYKDKGTMAIVGRNRAVAEAAGIKLKGFVAWMAWLMVHLMSIIGVKNRLLILINWMWQYITYDQSLRLIIRSSERKNKNISNKTSENEKNSNDFNVHRPLVGV